jgi:hypothetical protein
MISRRLVVRILLVIFLVTFSFSSVFAQQEERAPKTFQLFASEDDSLAVTIVNAPSIGMPTKQNILRKRKVIFNPIMFDLRWDTFKKGDRLVGKLFGDENAELTVTKVANDESDLLIYVSSKNKNWSGNIWVRKEKLTTIISIHHFGKEFLCKYTSDGNDVEIHETEKPFYVAPKKKVVETIVKRSTPKRIPLFSQKDDPTNRIKFDKNKPNNLTTARMRKAYVNEKLSSDFEELIIGDTIEGYLFEDLYFEGTVRKIVGKGNHLVLDIVGISNLRNRADIIRIDGYIFVTIIERDKRREIAVYVEEERPGYHIVWEIDLTKLPRLKQSHLSREKTQLKLKKYMESGVE